MPASKYIEACCLDLAMAQVLPSDRDLIHLFRIQRLVDRASRVHDIEDLESMTEREIERFHLSARALQSDLAAIKSSIDDETLSKRSFPSFI